MAKVTISSTTFLELTESIVREDLSNITNSFLQKNGSLRHLFKFIGIELNDVLAYSQLHALHYFRYIHARKDLKDKVYYRGGKYIYHLSKTCEHLRGTYRDYFIPEDIKSRNDDELTQAFRIWFYKNFDVLDINSFIILYNNDFANKYNLNPIHDIKEISHPIHISKIEIDQYFDVIGFNHNINNVIRIKNQLNNSSSQYNLEDVKNQAIALFFEYVKWFNGLQPTFQKENEILLDYFGLRMCYTCKKSIFK